MEYKHGDTILGESRVSDLQGLKERLRSMPPEAILAELDRWVHAEERAGREPDADVISACYEVLDEVDPVPVPDRAYETSRALFAQEHPEYMEPAPAAQPGGKRRFRTRGRRLSLAAAIALLIVGGTVAFAFELPQRLLVSMGFETFLVGETVSNMRLLTPTEDGYYTLEEALTGHGIRTYTPKWMPDDLRLTEIVVTDGALTNVFVASYAAESSGDSAPSAVIMISAFKDNDATAPSLFEDNGTRDTVFSEENNLEFLITANMDQKRINWQAENCIGSVYGSFSEDDVEKIIESISLEVT